MMDDYAVSQAVKRFEQESKVNHKIGEIKKNDNGIERELNIKC